MTSHLPPSSCLPLEPKIHSSFKTGYLGFNFLIWKLHNPTLKISHLINSCEMLTRESKIRCIHYSRIFFCVIFSFVFNCSQLQNVNVLKFQLAKWNEENLWDAMNTLDFLSISKDDYTNCMHYGAKSILKEQSYFYASVFLAQIREQILPCSRPFCTYRGIIALKKRKTFSCFWGQRIFFLKNF